MAIAVTNPWRRSILQQLQSRNKREQQPFEPVIVTCNSLFEKIDSLQREKLLLENNPSSLSANVTNEKLVQLQNEIKEYKKTSTKKDATINELKAQLQSVLKENADLKYKCNDAAENLEATKTKCSSLQETIQELESQINLVNDEHTALQIAYSSLKNKYDGMEINYTELVTRWMALKAKDAEILNQENEKIIKIQNEKMRQQLQEAANVMVVTQEVVNEMNAISEDKISNPLLIDAILPSKVAFSFEGHDSEIYALKWNISHGLHSGGGDRKVKMWEIGDSQSSLINCLSGSNASVTSIDIFEEFLVASSNDYASRVWTLNDTRLRRTLTGHSNKVMSVKFLGVSNKVVSGSYDRTLKIWDLNRNACVRTLFAGSSCNDLVNIDSKETLVASGHFDKRIRFWDTRADCNANDIQLQGKITSLDVSSDGRWLLCSVRDDTLKCLDLRMNQVVRDYTADGFAVGCDWTRAKFSPDNRYVACGGSDSAIFIWDFLTAKLETTLVTNSHSGTVVTVEWHPKGHLFVSADRNKKIVVWKWFFCLFICFITLSHFYSLFTLLVRISFVVLLYVYPIAQAVMYHLSYDKVIFFIKFSFIIDLHCSAYLPMLCRLLLKGDERNAMF